MTSVFGPMLLVCNPRAGRGSAPRVLEEVRRYLAERSLDHDVAFTTTPGDASRIAHEAVEEGCRFLVAVGGDGTIHEVVNGMMAAGAASDDAVLGIVAAGTSSDFIKTFGIPATPAHAATHLDGPESFPIDVGVVTYRADASEATRYFVNVAEVGLGAVVARRAGRLPGVLGPLLYPLALWLSLLGHRHAQVTVDLVDRTYEGPMINLVVANGQFFGSGMKIAPRAAPTDGLLDIQVQHPSKRDVIAQWPKVYRGEHLPHPDVLEAKRVRCSIESKTALPVEADGEVLGKTPASFELRRDALRLKV